MYLIFILLITILPIILFFLYIKIKYRFWSNQPINSKYNLYYKYFYNGIITTNNLEINNYTNINNITFYNFEIINESLKKKIYLFFKIFYNLNYDQFNSLFYNHNNKCYISLYLKPKYYNSKNNIEKTNEIIANITTKPCYLNIYKKKINTEIYIIDYLNILNTYQKENIVYELFQTHLYYQIKKNKNMVYLFKKENRLYDNLVDLIKYDSYIFNVKQILNTKKNKLFGNIFHIFKVNKQNFKYFIHFFEENKIYFELTLLTNIENLIENIENNNFIIYLLSQHDSILCAYVFNNIVNKTTNYDVTCSCSINNCSNIKIFIEGFKYSLNKINNNLLNLNINNISHNNILINYLISYTSIIKKYKCAYYLYNYVYQSFNDSNKVFLLI